jgi:hypothetical protein
MWFRGLGNPQQRRRIKMKKPTVSIDEILHEINNGAGLLQTDIFREKLTHAILRFRNIVEERKLATPTKPKKTRAVAPQMTLQQWEETKGVILNPSMLKGWITQKGFCTTLISQLVEEFRTEMLGKGLRYADFVAAFQTYLNKGYLSKKPEQVLLVNSPYATSFKDREFNRGVAL